MNDDALRDDAFPKVVCPDRAAWRDWLTRHHAGAPGAWLIYYKKHTGKASISYRESVLEALCFGWIDGLKRRLDDERYTHRFTPRQAGSRWSDLNIRLARELIDRGLMQPAGRAAFDRRKTGAEATGRARPDRTPVLPAELERAIRAEPESWRQ